MSFKGVLLLALSLSFSAFGQPLRLDAVPNPSGAGSLQAHWAATADDGVLLSWLEKGHDGSLSLRYATWHGGKWSEARTVIANRPFFRQPAESPSVLAFRNGSLLAEWVELPDRSADTENLYVSASKAGIKWTTPAIAHRDRSPVQHALASMIDSGEHEASIVWLEALKGEDAPSALKRTVVDSVGRVVKEETLDADVCTCCPTSIVRTQKGLLVAYRDHTAQDIRDIAVIRFEKDRWQPSRILNSDNWKINACPVNGAAAAVVGDRVAIAWYTDAQNSPRTQVAFSNDGGANFTKPVRVSTGNSLGHVSVALEDQNIALVSWLEEGKGSEAVELLVRRVSPLGSPGPVTKAAQGSRSSIGYPRLLHAGGVTWIAWGNSGAAKIQTARISPDGSGTP